MTVRKHLPAIAGRLGLRLIQQRRVVTLPKGGQRAYERQVLVRRGRWAPPAEEQVSREKLEEAQEGTDHARNMDSPTRVIRRQRAMQRSYRRSSISRRHRGRTRQVRPFPKGAAADREATEGEAAAQSRDSTREPGNHGR